MDLLHFEEEFVVFTLFTVTVLVAVSLWHITGTLFLQYAQALRFLPYMLACSCYVYTSLFATKAAT